MVNVTIDGRTFTLSNILKTETVSCEMEPEISFYMDYFFKENGKTHFARVKMERDPEEDYLVEDDSVPVKWFVEE